MIGLRGHSEPTSSGTLGKALHLYETPFLICKMRDVYERGVQPRTR